jgi:hypothetical protein
VFPVVELSRALPNPIVKPLTGPPSTLMLIDGEAKEEVKAILDSQMRYNQLLSQGGQNGEDVVRCVQRLWGIPIDMTRKGYKLGK